jgi:uncharacterized membrane protein YcaP (DUF421 family)
VINPENILQQTSDLNTLEMSIRALIVFAYGLVAVRLAGRRVFGHWSALDIVVSIIVGSNLSRALTGNSAMIPTLVASSLVLAVHWVLAMAVVRHRGLAKIVEGSAVHLAKAGKLDEARRQKSGVSESDLNEALRQSEVEDVSETRLVTLEPSGKISILKK